MPAQDKKQVFNFENNFERAAQSALAAAGYNEAFIEGGKSELPPSRLEVSFTVGEALNESTLENGDRVYDYFSGRLSVRIVTFRPEDQPSLLPGVSTLHSEWAAGVRAAMQERAAPFTRDNLPLYTVTTIRPLGSARDLDPRWLEDFTRLDFHVEFGIRPDAWPV